MKSKYSLLLLNAFILLGLFVLSISTSGNEEFNNEVNDSQFDFQNEKRFDDENEGKKEEIITLSEDQTKEFKIAIANKNKSYEVVSSEDTYDDAKYKVNKLDNDDLIIVHNEKIIYVKYGLVNLNTKPITENTYFYVNGVRNYLNGSFAVDALFIDRIDNQYQIMISNTIGLIDIKDVELIPLAYIKSPSFYFANSYKQLVHAISHDLYSIDSYDYSGPIDYAPSYFVKDVKYYSYDGIYFYSRLQDLVDDKRENSSNRAINVGKPHYSYFVYLPIRSETSYQATELNKFITYELTRRGLKSQSILLNTGQNFINTQTTYKMNAAMELVWAFHESHFGTSNLAKQKYNLFGMNAIDSNPYGNANSFNSLQAGINYHADYFVARQYLNHNSIVYSGSSFGNKGTGFNVSYASDPYWGEKIAGFYFQMDDFLGSRDYKKYKIGITEKPSEIYLQPNEFGGILYIETTNKDVSRTGLPLLIVGEEKGYYKVKLNAMIVNNQISYSNVLNYNSNIVGYVLKENIVIVE